MKYALLIIILLGNNLCFGFGIRDDLTQRFYGNPTEVTTKDYHPSFGTGPDTVTDSYSEMRNGVYLNTHYTGHIDYDLNYDAKNMKDQEHRFYTLIELLIHPGPDYNITMSENSIEILTPHYTSTYSNRWGNWDFDIKTIIIFDENKRLKTLEIIRLSDNSTIEKYEYVFDSSNRLISVYAITSVQNSIEPA
jgi:hypothetical protein